MPLQTRQGPPKKRRSNTKSRSGCSTCKRRHIRCDEEHPQWLVDRAMLPYFDDH
ncbi:hypothetical protein BFJ65_g14583 [Fusarium oxysporum f. sp. cepae]|uniref:Zn(2)-C6 fungal-type domain-containing protein n=1 Tax=Fusarium oxysporum f. sp. cepae TaxID=396571 RepID=A0A3L6N188_FUSOX|nr:hypothetical protein BFJ65_g14583 [Fusarium oxysporum f. sp. cepae]